MRTKGGCERPGGRMIAGHRHRAGAYRLIVNGSPDACLWTRIVDRGSWIVMGRAALRMWGQPLVEHIGRAPRKGCQSWWVMELHSIVVNSQSINLICPLSTKRPVHCVSGCKVIVIAKSLLLLYYYNLTILQKLYSTKVGKSPFIHYWSKYHSWHALLIRWFIVSLYCDCKALSTWFPYIPYTITLLQTYYNFCEVKSGVALILGLAIVNQVTCLNGPILNPTREMLRHPLVRGYVNT